MSDRAGEVQGRNVETVDGRVPEAVFARMGDFSPGEAESAARRLAREGDRAQA